jgi:anti-sigma factor RsiW
MNCQSVVNVEDLYAEGRLSPSRTASVRAHIKECASCSARLKDELLSLKGPSASAPKDLKNRMKALLAKIETEEPPPQAKPWAFDSEMWPVVTSIAIYLGLALLLAWTVPGAPSQRYGQAGTEAQP